MDNLSSANLGVQCNLNRSKNREVHFAINKCKIKEDEFQ